MYAAVRIFQNDPPVMRGLIFVSLGRVYKLVMNLRLRSGRVVGTRLYHIPRDVAEVVKDPRIRQFRGAIWGYAFIHVHQAVNDVGLSC